MHRHIPAEGSRPIGISGVSTHAEGARADGTSAIPAEGAHSRGGDNEQKRTLHNDFHHHHHHEENNHGNRHHHHSHHHSHHKHHAYDINSLLNDGHDTFGVSNFHNSETIKDAHTDKYIPPLSEIETGMKNGRLHVSQYNEGNIDEIEEKREILRKIESLRRKYRSMIWY